jgi:hypothetical protein
MQSFATPLPLFVIESRVRELLSSENELSSIRLLLRDVEHDPYRLLVATELQESYCCSVVNAVGEVNVAPESLDPAFAVFDILNNIRLSTSLVTCREMIKSCSLPDSKLSIAHVCISERDVPTQSR